MSDRRHHAASSVDGAPAGAPCCSRPRCGSRAAARSPSPLIPLHRPAPAETASGARQCGRTAKRDHAACGARCNGTCARTGGGHAAGGRRHARARPGGPGPQERRRRSQPRTVRARRRTAVPRQHPGGGVRLHGRRRVLRARLASTLKIDNKEVANYLYTPREAEALLKGGVHRAVPRQPEGGRARAGRVLHRQGSERPRLQARRQRSSSRRASAPSISSSRSPTASARRSPSSRSRTGNRRGRDAILRASHWSRRRAGARCWPRCPPALARQEPKPTSCRRRVVRDLHYGDVLFYYYQDEDFEAITRLRPTSSGAACRTTRRRAQLLLGGLYLSLGLHNEAGEALRDAADASQCPRACAIAPGSISARSGTRAAISIAPSAPSAKCRAGCPPELEAEQHAPVRQHPACASGASTKPIALLNDWKGARTSPTGWRTRSSTWAWRWCARAWLAEADPFLTSVGTLESGAPRAAARCKDRANLALGFAYLQSNQPANARPALERVRSTGRIPTRRCSASGWADAALGEYQEALTPWMELRERNLLDAAVQESYLAVPYAFGKLSANAQAAENYETAVDVVRRRDRATSMSRSPRSNERQHARHAARSATTTRATAGSGSCESCRMRRNRATSITVLAGHDFQEGLKNYRDLAFLGTHARSLGRQHGGLRRHDRHARDAPTRERLPQRRCAAAPAARSSNAARARDELDGRLECRSRPTPDVAALGSPEERDQWARIQRLEAALADRARRRRDRRDSRDRLRLVEGRAVFPPRTNRSRRACGSERRTMKDLDLALHEAQNRWIRVREARARACRPTPASSPRASPRCSSASMRCRCAWSTSRRSRTTSSRSSPCRARGSRRTASPLTRCRRASRWPRCTTARPTPTSTAPRSRRRRSGERREPAPRRRRRAEHAEAAQPERRAQRRARPACRRPRAQRRAGARRAESAHDRRHLSIAGAALARAGCHAADEAQTIKRSQVASRSRSARTHRCPRAAPRRWKTTSLPRAAEDRSAVACRSAAPPGRPQSRSRRARAHGARGHAIDLQGAEAIKLYTTLLKAYPDYPRNDQVLYQLARAYETTGQPEQALATLDRMVEKYPRSSAAGRSAVPPRRAAVLGEAVRRSRRTPTRW